MRLFRSLRDLDANFTYGYDNAGLPLSVVAVAQGIGRPWEARLQHDLLGRETLRTMTDGVGRPSRQSVTRGGHSLYNRSCQLREDRRWRYHYDKQGNLVLKTKRKISPVAETPQGNRKSVFGLFSGSNTSKERREQEELIAWHPGDYAYTWLPNGMLGSVTRPDGKVVTFKYDALGRRIEKTFNGRVHRYLWDGDVVLHEWEYDETERPQQIVAENGEVSFDRPEPTDNLVTWVYDTDSYVPTAKLVNGKRYGIVSDYIGRPVQAYDEHGTVVWQADYDIYGNLLNLKGDRGFVPFRFQGMYYDTETELCYVRHRYYSCDTGIFISQDPIGLAGGNPTLYGYVFDSNTEIDPFGLDILYHYTNQSGMEGILQTKVIKPSLKELNPKDVRYGNGQYLSDIVPGTKTPSQLGRQFINVPNKHKYTHYVAIDVSGLDVTKGRDGVFVVRGDTDLDISDRIVGSGKVKCGG